MKTVCVIGDSHVDPLVHVAKDMALRDIRLTFFACHVDRVAPLGLAGAKLSPADPELRAQFARTSGGDGDIDIRAFDGFIVIGHGVWIGAAAALYWNYRSEHMRGPDGGKILLSDACFRAVVRDTLAVREAFRIARLIRSISAGPVAVVSGPNPGLGIPEDKIPAWWPPCLEAVRNGDDGILGAAYAEACAALAARLRVAVVPPLREVAANGVFNLREFSKLPGGRELDAGDMNEMMHGNAAYGVHLARALFGEAGPLYFAGR